MHLQLGGFIRTLIDPAANYAEGELLVECQRVLEIRDDDISLSWPRNGLRRVSYDSRAGTGCGELVDSAPHAIALTIGLHRGYLVIIGGIRLQRLHAHPEDRLWMALVEPDVIFRRLAQIIGIRPIVYDGVMVVVASRIIGGPSDDGDVVVGSFERWPFEDLDVFGLRRRRRILSGDGDAKD